MKLQEWLNGLNALIAANPEMLDYPIYVSSDAEGIGGYNKVAYTPQTALYIISDDDVVFDSEDLPKDKNGFEIVLLN